MASAKTGALISVCIQDVGKKLQVLDSIIAEARNMEIFARQKLVYEFIDQASNHSSKTKYEMVTLVKKENEHVLGEKKKS